MVDWCYDGQRKAYRWRQAKLQVRAKFPNLPEGSDGWFRAVANRFKRIR